MRVGMDELLEIDDDGKESMMNSFYGGLDANENQQKMAELQFEAWMRMLDSRVRDVCVIGRDKCKPASSRVVWSLSLLLDF